MRTLRKCRHGCSDTYRLGSIIRKIYQQGGDTNTTSPHGIKMRDIYYSDKDLYNKAHERYNDTLNVYTGYNDLEIELAKAIQNAKTPEEAQAIIESFNKSMSGLNSINGSRGFIKGYTDKTIAVNPDLGIKVAGNIEMKHPTVYPKYGSRMQRGGASTEVLKDILGTAGEWFIPGFNYDDQTNTPSIDPTNAAIDIGLDLALPFVGSKLNKLRKAYKMVQGIKRTPVPGLFPQAQLGRAVRNVMEKLPDIAVKLREGEFIPDLRFYHDINPSNLPLKDIIPTMPVPRDTDRMPYSAGLRGIMDYIRNGNNTIWIKGNSYRELSPEARQIVANRQTHPINKNQMGGDAGPTMIQTEAGETGYTDGKLVKVAADTRHENMASEQVTDSFSPDSYIFSDHKTMKIPRGLAELMVLGPDLASLEKKDGQQAKEPKMITLGSKYFGNKKSMTPAELSEVIRKYFPISTRKDNAFTDLTNKIQISNRDKDLQAVMQLSEALKQQVEQKYGVGEDGLIKAQTGGNIEGLDKMIAEYQKLFEANQKPITQAPDYMSSIPDMSLAAQTALGLFGMAGQQSQDPHYNTSSSLRDQMFPTMDPTNQIEGIERQLAERLGVSLNKAKMYGASPITVSNSLALGMAGIENQKDAIALNARNFNLNQSSKKAQSLDSENRFNYGVDVKNIEGANKKWAQTFQIPIQALDKNVQNKQVEGEWIRGAEGDRSNSNINYLQNIQMLEMYKNILNKYSNSDDTKKEPTITNTSTEVVVPSKPITQEDAQAMDDYVVAQCGTDQNDPNYYQCALKAMDAFLKQRK